MALVFLLYRLLAPLRVPFPCRCSTAGFRVLISLAVYQTLPNIYGTLGIVPAIVGSTLMVYGDEKRGEVSADEQAAVATEVPDASGRSEANRPTV